MASEMYDRLMADMKSAMKAHDMKAVNAIRGVVAKAKDLTVNAGKEMTDEAIVSVVAKGVKQREESIAQFTAAGRAELAEGEKAEMEFLRRYLPAQLWVHPQRLQFQKAETLRGKHPRRTCHS